MEWKVPPYNLSGATGPGGRTVRGPVASEFRLGQGNAFLLTKGSAKRNIAMHA